MRRGAVTELREPAQGGSITSVGINPAGKAASDGGEGGRARGPVRHEQGAHGPGVRLLAGRQGQFRGRPGRCRSGRGRVPGYQDRGPGAAGVPGPGGALPGHRGGHPAVPRHRDRAAVGQQHPPGRPGGGAGVPGGVRGQRPDRAQPRPCPADQQPRGGDGLHRRRSARHRPDPRAGGRRPRLRAAGRGHAAGDPAGHTRPGASRARSSPGSWTRSHRAATWP